MLMATARLGATTGLSSKRSRTSYRGGDLGPVGRFVALRLIVEGGDNCLELVRPDRAAGKGGGEERDPLLGSTPVPPAVVLLRHGDERPAAAGFHTGHNPR